MDAVGSERAALIGESEGGPLSMLFAAAHPERTLGLILAGAEVKEDKTDDWPWGESTREEFEQSMETVHERWSRVPASLNAFVPSRGDDPRLLKWYARLKVQSASPTAAVAFMRMAHDIDVRHVAPAIRVPTLILHSAEDQVCHVENARYLARTIPGARYVELPGGDHVMYAEPADLALAEIREFLTGVREAPEPDRILATVLFTDLVGSTERATELGLRVRRSGPGDSLRRCRCGRRFCARARGACRCPHRQMRGDRRQARLASRFSVGARVAAQARPGEVLVSSTVSDLIAGSGIELTDRGLHALKGVEGERRLYAVA